MISLTVWIEKKGKFLFVGRISGESSQDARFVYDKEYIEKPDSRPISISLPLREEPYSEKETRIFFDGLLPEGYTRRCVAEEMRVDVQDYVTLLKYLGKECLGAVQILESSEKDIEQGYKKMSDEELVRFAREGASESAVLVTKSHLSLTGASGKTGLYRASNEQWYIPLGSSPSTHIVKQSHVRLKKIVTNEQLCLLTAKKLGIEIPESFIMRLSDTDDETVLFVTKRYDRKFSEENRMVDNLPIPYRLHQEDFAQALGIPAYLKYEKDNQGYLRKMFELLKKHSSNPLEDQLKLWDICIFNYLVGNTDNHIKNLSLLYDESLQSVRLSPAYDLVSTVCYEQSTDEMAIGIGGAYKLGEITREHFEKEAERIGLGKKLAMKRFDKMKSEFCNALIEAAKELREKGFSDTEVIVEKIRRNFYENV